MKKTIRILLCVMFAAILSAACVGCGESGPKSFEIVGAKNLSFVQGTVTDEILLEGVSVVFDDETTAAVTLVKGEGDDLNQPGSYEISYKYEEKSVKVRVLVYGDIVFSYGDDVLGTTKAIGYREAFASSNFTSSVKAKDSFGTPLTVTVKDGSQEFNQKPGDYVVTYTAKDAMNQEKELTVTYTVTNDKNLTAENATVNYQDESVSVVIGLDGVTDAFLMENGAIVNPDNYTLTETSLTMSASYFLNKAVGDVNFALCSEYGVTDFKVTVADNGTPVFNLDEIKENAQVKAGDNVLVSLPKKEIPLHSDYTYDCTLTAQGTDYKAEVTADGIKLTKTDGTALKIGSYTLTVKATNGEKSDTKSVVVRVYDEEKEVPMAFTVAAGGGREYADYETEDRNVKRYRLYDLSIQYVVDYGRLQYSLSDLTTYKGLRMDIMYNDSSAKSGELAGISLLSARYASGAAYLSVTYTDKNGSVVAASELKIGEWYSVYISFSKVADAGSMYIYPTYGKNETVDMYIANTFFVKAVEGETELFLQASDGSAVTFGQTGTDDEGNAIYTYAATEGFTIDSWKIGYTLPDLTRYNYLAFEYRVREHAENKLYNIVSYGQGDLFTYFDANGNIIDKSTLQIGVWYTVYVDVSSNVSASNTWLYVAGTSSTKAVKIDFKNIRYDKKGVIYGEGEQGVTFASEGNAAGKFAKKLSDDGNIIRSYSSDGTSAWTGRMWFNYSSTDYKQFVVKYKVTECSDLGDSTTFNNIAWQIESKADNIKYYDESGNEVSPAKLEVGKVYTLVADLSSWTKTGNKTVYPTFGRGVAVSFDILEAYLDTAPVVSE